MNPPTGTQTMRAVVQDRYGSDPAEVLSLADVERPTITDDEVLIRVEAAGVDRGTWHLMTGLPYAVRLAGFGVRAPKTPVPGLDVAGTVVAVGDEVTRFGPGDEVFGIGKGSFAEYTAAPAEKLALKPADLSFEQAAALAVSGLTALQAVRDQAEVREGERVLVLGASGGVGSFAVQIAKAYGAEVTGVASTAKVDLVRALGADYVVDYREEDALAEADRYDVIIDTGGNRRLRDLRHSLTPRGRLVIVGGETDGRWLGGTDRQLRAMVLSLFVGQSLGTFVSSENGDDLRTLAELVDSGSVTPAVDRIYPLAEAADAIDQVATGRARGKVVVTP